MDDSHSVLYLYIFDTGSVFSSNRTIILLVPQAFARSSTMASSGVRENVYPNNKLEMCWKILFLIICYFYSLT